MERVIAIVNQKGGCGKTTTSINLSASLAFLGKRVLLIDLDSQAHSSIGLGINPEDLEKNLFDVLDDTGGEDLSLNEVIVKVYKNLDLAPAHVILSAIEQKLSGKDGRENKLADKIKSLRSAYDFIVIDCPPSLGILTFNALSAADEIIVPVEPSFFSLHGLKKLLETVELVNEIKGKKLGVNALVTIYDKRTKYARNVLKEVRDFFGDNTFSVVIRRNIKLQEASQTGKPITKFDKDSAGFEDYMNFAVEVIEKYKDESESENRYFSRDVEGTEVVVDNAPYEGEEFSVEVVSDGINEIKVPIEEGNVALCEPKVEIKCAPVRVEGGVLFSFKAPDTDIVEIAGEFNNWTPQRLNTPFPGEEIWTKMIPLAPGEYKYKYIYNGNWVADPDNEKRVPNQFGGEDSLIIVE